MNLVEKLRKIEILLARAKTEGERAAVERAKQRVLQI